MQYRYFFSYFQIFLLLFYSCLFAALASHQCHPYPMPAVPTAMSSSCRGVRWLVRLLRGCLLRYGSRRRNVLDGFDKTFGTKSRAGWLRRQRPDCFYFILLNSFAIFSILFCLSLSNLSFCFNIRNSFSYFILSHVSSLLIIFPL